MMIFFQNSEKKVKILTLISEVCLISQFWEKSQNSEFWKKNKVVSTFLVLILVRSTVYQI